MSAARLPRMPWYPNDFAGATRGWPLEARGIYRELLDAQWTMGSLPADQKWLQSIAGATPKQWQTAWPLISPKFVSEDGQLMNLRLEEHRQEAIELYNKRKSGAEKTNTKRWGGSDD